MGFLLFHLLLSFSLSLPILCNAQANGIIPVLAQLNASQDSFWSSPSSDFAFGFQQLGSRDLFLLAIWYAKIPEKTIVWYGNEGSPVVIGSKVELTAGQGLLLSGPQGQVLWKSNIISGVVVARAVMNDTGNFVIEESNSNKLWESFRNPSDTILSIQVLEIGDVVSSRRSETNFSTGRFQLRLLKDGNVVLNSINLPTFCSNTPYYSSQTGRLNSISPGKQLGLDESGVVYVLRENGERIDLTSARREDVSMDSFYYRLTLNFDGVLVLYYHPKNGTSTWTSNWRQPENICIQSLVDKGSGVCGYNSVCTLNSEDRPICDCPKGYSLLDPSDQYGSCKSSFLPSCDEEDLNPDLYTFEELINIDWPKSDYEVLEPFSEDECRTSCLHDCMCAVALYRLGTTCWKKKLPLSNGRKDNGLYGKAFIKLRKDNRTFGDSPNPDSKKKNQDTLILAGAVLLGGSVFGNFLLMGVICFGFFLIYTKKNKFMAGNNESFVETNIRCFTYKQLVEATDGFKEELGRGAFGIVYKGELRKYLTSPLVAVKKLNSVAQDSEKEFRTEVNVIARTHHKNLVRLLGFCDQDQQRLLVYEYLSNGTLASFLFGDLKPSWKQRTQIAFGISRGILYLHEECGTQIIHCDIKPQNILLDDYYNARISDFGLAKLLMMNQSQTHTAIRGTKGYVAPEWFRNMAITTKVDVYSFGVMLLEIICCRRSVDKEPSNEQRAILTDWAYDCYREGKLDCLIGFDAETSEDWRTLERFVKVGIWCIQEEPSLRPNMRKVTQMLEGIVEVPVPPCPFPYAMTGSVSIEVNRDFS